MRQVSSRTILLDIPLIEERYTASLLASFAVHGLALALALFGARFLPHTQALQMGTGPGGGTGGGSYVVGVADELAGGTGMTKPSLIPQPPALPPEERVKEVSKPAAIPLPDTVMPRKPTKKEAARQAKKEPAPPRDTNVIPTQAQPGAGGTGGVSGGSGGGRGGGSGVSIGSGTGGFADSWYARAVESRIGSNWIKPVDTSSRIEIVFSFMVGPDGSIYDIRKVKSCGNDALDLTAERAIRASTPLAPPPPELRGRPLEFAAQFVYPPSP